MERSFYGIPPENMLQEHMIIKVNVTDNFETIEDFLNFGFIAPYYLILNYIVSVLSPLATILGLINYRLKMYNIFCRKKYHNHH